MSKKLTTHEFIIKANIVHNNKYNYSLSKYINSKTKIHIICINHGYFYQTPNSHLSGKGCKLCSFSIVNKKNFVEKANKVHNNKYCYKQTTYNGLSHKAIITCPVHGDFIQSLSRHIYNKSGCPYCSKNKNYTTKEFIDIANKKHNYKYDYTKLVYVNNYTKVTIICPSHGSFTQSPKKHLINNGCKKCGINKRKIKQTKPLSLFIREANIIHNNLYLYDNVNYINSNTKINITCKKHGNFSQLPLNHLKGNGCPKCSYNISKKETLWLSEIENKINRKLIKQFRVPNTSYVCDGYDPITNTIYEFNGDFWHGNPQKYNQNMKNPINNKTYKELYDNTISKKQHIIKLGYYIISIWESDYDETQSKSK